MSEFAITSESIKSYRNYQVHQVPTQILNLRILNFYHKSSLSQFCGGKIQGSDKLVSRVSKIIVKSQKELTKDQQLKYFSPLSVFKKYPRPLNIQSLSIISPRFSVFSAQCSRWTLALAEAGLLANSAVQKN